jgi:hypothetical protein
MRLIAGLTVALAVLLLAVFVRDDSPAQDVEGFGEPYTFAEFAAELERHGMTVVVEEQPALLDEVPSGIERLDPLPGPVVVALVDLGGTPSVVFVYATLQAREATWQSEADVYVETDEEWGRVTDVLSYGVDNVVVRQNAFGRVGGQPLEPALRAVSR